MTGQLPVRLRASIAAATAYRQGRRPPAGGFKLSSNENPYSPLPGVVEAIREAAAYNRYPDATAAALRGPLAARFGVEADGVQVGAGSVAVLAQLIQAASGAGDEVVYPWRSFEAYPGLVTVSGARGVAVPLDSDGRHDLSAMAKAVTGRTRVVIVCSPNNPTGPAVRRAEFDRFLAAIPQDLLVVLDEAYHEFVTDPDAVDGRHLVAGHPNLVIARTFSKAYGLAALRIGYAIGHPAIIRAAQAAAIPLSVTAQAQAGALASLDREDELMERVARIVGRRDRMWHDLVDQGWQLPEAQGNFVWFPTGSSTEAAADVFFDAGLAVRPFSGDGIRVSVGEAESVDVVLRAAKRVLGAQDHGRLADPATQA
ncbi:MAG TPA: histidinol-phosphate transaminase [Microbacteriaceae bacterium]|nr:histidinol-phosphate transaminase [Microbacteriaceae bacterium]